jgi:4-amino-4-deoxy-L-arabinose transferase-like glycosyltransferase
MPAKPESRGQLTPMTRLASARVTSSTPTIERLGAGRTLLVLGIALRILVFAFLSPLNNDAGHFDMIRYMARQRALPAVAANTESYQPPLYYLLAAPLYAATGRLKCVQALSLALSILTLLVFYRLLYVDKLLPDETPRRYAFLMACFLPQFVMFGLYVSNDALAVFIGALVVAQVLRFAARSALGPVVLLALLVGLGLLTKATFLAFLPVLFVLVAFVLLRRGHSAPKAFAAALALLFLAAGLGSWTFVRNYRQVKNPFVSNLDQGYPWVAAQQRSYRGAASFFDVNLWKLLASPAVSTKTEDAYPLLLYGTFWYQHIPESNFMGDRRAPFFYLGSAIYVFALVPTLAFFVGLFLLLKRLPRFVATCDLSQQRDQRLLAVFVTVAFLFGNLALILAVALKYHVWTLMQGRLLFPSFCGLLIPFGVGVAAFAGNDRAPADPPARAFLPARVILQGAMLALLVCFGLYFSSEISHLLGGWPFF